MTTLQKVDDDTATATATNGTEGHEGHGKKWIIDTGSRLIDLGEGKHISLGEFTRAIAHHDMITAMTATVSFYVPSTKGDQRAIDQRAFQNRTDIIARLFARLFGGSSVTFGAGYWFDDDGRLVTERINVVTSTTDPGTLAGHYEKVIDQALAYGQLWDQNAVMVDVNGTALLIDL